MQRTRWWLGIYIILLSCILFAFKTYATATITAATRGTNVSADRANDAISPSRTGLGQIRIAEGANGDIPASQASGTIILTIATGWIFDTSTGRVSYTAARDITNAGITMTTTTITIIVTTDASANARDTVNIDSIFVRALTGSNQTAAGNILRRSTNAGTTAVVGITNNTTNFGSLSQTTGSLRNLEIILPGQSWGGAGVGVSGTPNYLFPNLAFSLVDIRAVDQFDNIITSFAGNRTLTYTGVTSSSGANTYTTAVSFTAGDSTTTLNTTLKPSGNFRITVSSGTVVYGTSSQFTLMAGAYLITAPASIDLSDIPATTSQTTVRNTSTNFTVEDQKGFSSGYYTTLQCNNLSDGINTIANTNISLSGSTLTLLSGNANASVTTSLGSSMQVCNSALAFIRRNSGAAGSGTYSQYGASISLQVTIPAWQAVGDYSSTITYTLIEN